MPTLGLALGRFACFCLFSLAPLPSPGEGHARASWLLGDRHAELGQVPSVNPKTCKWAQPRSAEPLQTGEMNSCCLPLRFCDCLFHGIPAAIGNLYEVPVLKKICFHLVEDTQSRIILHNERGQEKNWKEVKCGMWVEYETVTLHTPRRTQVLGWEGTTSKCHPCNKAGDRDARSARGNWQHVPH